MRLEEGLDALALFSGGTGSAGKPGPRGGCFRAGSVGSCELPMALSLVCVRRREWASLHITLAGPPSPKFTRCCGEGVFRCGQP